MSVEEAFVLAYIAMNLLALLAFLWDKMAARHQRPRIKERSLLLLALLGPFGAFAAMRLFHHKTRRRMFMLVPLFVLLHVVLILALTLKLL